MIMSDRIIPNLSHLNSEDIVKILKENSSNEIHKNKEFLSTFLDNADKIGKIESHNIEKISRIMESTLTAAGNGGCGSVSGGCC